MRFCRRQNILRCADEHPLDQGFTRQLGLLATSFPAVGEDSLFPEGIGVAMRRGIPLKY